MNSEYALPIVLLVFVLALSPLVLWLDSRVRRLNQRVEEAIQVRHPLFDDSQTTRSIRMARNKGSKLGRFAYRFLRMPLDLPLAHVAPAWAVFATALVIGVGVQAFAGIFVAAPFALAAAIASTYVFTRGVFGWELTRYQDKLLRQLPDAIELVMSATRAGLPVTEAFRAINREMPDPMREEFRRVGNEIALGLAADEALMNVQCRTHLTEFAIFAVTIAIQGRSGGRIAEAIQNLAEIVRQRLTIAMRGEALSAEAMLSARIISVLPFVGGIAMTIIHPGYLTPLFTDPRGKQMFVVGICTLVAGIYTMRRLVKSVARE